MTYTKGITGMDATASGWQTNDAGKLEVTDTGLYIEGEFLTDRKED